MLLLVVWIGSRRFGPARDLCGDHARPGRVDRRVRLRAGQGRPIAPLGARYVGELVAEGGRAPGHAAGKSAVDQAAHVDRIAARRGLTVRATTLLERARGVASGAPSSDALALAKDAHALRERLLGNEPT
ncbi:MAG: hypothetical protein M5U28_02090 [Sandaracinaceae bacterium]|nr:hypothetical protein [Sandaracinaceae bacterium]